MRPTLRLENPIDTSRTLAAGARVRLFAELGRSLGATADESGYFAFPLKGMRRAPPLPLRLHLGQNYPNPFNPSTIIPYQLPAPTQVRLEVFNILGQRVATLVDGARPAGFHTAAWDATDASGRVVASGVYLCRLLGGGERLTRSMVLLDGPVVAAGGGGSGGAGDPWGGTSAGRAGAVFGGASDPSERIAGAGRPTPWSEAAGTTGGSAPGSGTVGGTFGDATGRAGGTGAEARAFPTEGTASAGRGARASRAPRIPQTGGPEWEPVPGRGLRPAATGRSTG